MPYVLALGNHDYDDNAPKRDTTRLTEYFALERMREWPSFGGVQAEGKLDNSFHLVRMGGRDWIILALEVRTYSPVLNSVRQTPLEDFQFQLKLADRATATTKQQ